MKLWKCRGVRLNLLDVCRGSVSRAEVMQKGDLVFSNPAHRAAANAQL